MARILVIKVGSQSGEGAMKEGMVIDHLPTSEPLSDHSKRCFAHVLVEDDVMASVESAMEPVMDGKKCEFAKTGYVDLDNLALDLEDPSLVAKWRGSDVVPVQDGTSIPLDFMDSTLGSWEEVDNNAVTSGTYTVGPGKDYANFTTAQADIETASSGLTGDLSFMQDASITGQGTTPGISIYLKGYTLTIGNNSPHGGDPTTGYTITTGISWGYQINVNCHNSEATGGKIIVRDLNVRVPITATGANTVINCISHYEIDVHDNILHSEGSTSGGGTHVGAIFVAANFGSTGSSKFYIWNNEVSGWGSTQWAGISPDDNGYTCDFRVENNTVHGCVRGINCGADDGDGASIICENNACFDNSGADFYGHANSTGNNNASEDSSAGNGNWNAGANNETGINPGPPPANEFVSATITSTDYLKVTDDGVCWDGGTTPGIAGNTTGIRGNARSSSIGADEYEIVAPTVTSVDPDNGAEAGGTSVSVFGTGFLDGATVTFDGNPATSVSFVDAGQIDCDTPAGTGVVDVVVTNPDTGDGTLVNGYTYNEPPPPQSSGSGSGLSGAITAAMAMGY